MSIHRLVPAIKNYIWGGRRLRDIYGKCGELPLAESWELSFHPDGLTRVDTGESLKDLLSSGDLGTNCAAFSDFPLLVKWIDAESALSVQVHPTDEDAMLYEKSYGKTEMWYIVSAEADAGIYLGFRRAVTENEVKEAIRDEELTELLRFVPVKAGECYFIPAGTVHAIGAGCLIAEIQQNSNITYRLFDYGRRDAMGNSRPLHIAEALRVMKRDEYTSPCEFLPVAGEKTLGISRYFHTAEITVTEDRHVTVDPASFLALFCVRGEGRVGELSVKQGESLFLTAGTGRVQLSGEMVLIAVSVRRYTVIMRDKSDGISASLYDDLGRLHAEQRMPLHARDAKEIKDMLYARLLQAYALEAEDAPRKDETKC